MIIDGRRIARRLLAQVRTEVEALGRTPLVRILVQQPSAATESYLRIKQEKAEETGMVLQLIRPENDATTDEVIAKIALGGADAIIVQLPIADAVDTVRVLNAIPVELDADVLSEAAYARFLAGEEGALLPPVVGAIREILAEAGIELPGKRAVVVGGGRLVGQPAAAWLSAEGASVTTITREIGDLGALRDADIVITGAGSPGLILPEHLKQGVVLIDAGTSESGGAIVGDADPACAEVASFFTPVPGGVGPIAVACLMQNVVELTRLRAS